MQKDSLLPNSNRVSGCLRRLIGRLWGFPIWVEHHDGEIHARRAMALPDGRIITRKIHGKIIGNPDGTFHPRSYCEKWYPRETLLFPANDLAHGAAGGGNQPQTH